MEKQSSASKKCVPCDLEANIQKERILNIVDDTIRKMELSLCLPSFLKDDCQLLHPWLEENQIDQIKELCYKYMRRQGSSLFQSKTTSFSSFASMKSESLKSGDKNRISRPNKSEASEYRIDDELSKILNLLYNHQEIRNISSENMLSESASTFINTLKDLQICIAERLDVSPQEEIKRETELSEMCKQNEKDKEEVMKLKEKLNKQFSESEQMIELKKSDIKKEQDKIENIQKQCREHIRKKREEAEKQINWDMKNSEFRLEELQNALKISQHQKETQLKEHLANEKELRTKRFKVESQLVAMLQKYDTDIGDRQAQLEEMTAAYEEEKEQMIKLQECFEQQEIEYQCLMYEKEMYEKQVWEAKLYEIQCKVAARKIQRFYRSYLAQSKARGKKGKGKGKGKKKK